MNAMTTPKFGINFYFKPIEIVENGDYDSSQFQKLQQVKDEFEHRFKTIETTGKDFVLISKDVSDGSHGAFLKIAGNTKLMSRRALLKTGFFTIYRETFRAFIERVYTKAQAMTKWPPRQKGEEPVFWAM